MLMVIFGAGASHDSFRALQPPNVNEQGMPLAKDLFDRRFADFFSEFPKCRPLIQRLQEPEVNVENQLEIFQREATAYKTRIVQLVSIRYYLGRMLSQCQNSWTQDVTKGVTNYATLLDQVARQKSTNAKVCLVTFNYDTLLENALIDLGIPLRSITDYVSGNYKVIKLHGSTNWAHPIRNIQSHRTFAQELINDIIDKADNLDVDSRSYEIVEEDPFMRPANRPLFPALAIPVENKQEYECPKEHIDTLEACLTLVTKLLIIGWKANDSLFLETLSDHLSKNAQIMVVSGSDAGRDDIVRRLSGKLRATGHKADYLTAKPGFSNLILSSEWSQFLAET